MTLPCPHCGSPELRVHDVAVVLAGEDEVRRGLLGWASAIVGVFRFDGIAIRMTTEAELQITMPARKDGAGRLHPSVIPLESEVIRRIEAAVVAAYLKTRPKAWRERRS